MWYFVVTESMENQQKIKSLMERYEYSGKIIHANYKQSVTTAIL